MKKLILFLLLFSVPCLAQTVAPHYAEARTGETVTLEILISEPADQINVYRKTGVTTSATLIGSVPVLENVWEYEWLYLMPGGTTTQYRLFVVPKKGAELLNESNGVRVKRIK